ncbi:MAG: pyridoxine 5'-phosphate synthase [Planctomycetota bacterium]|nr:MAG: pyridoxine 5'-phosphate synthase [Planctomycetota bacterium]
MTSLSVNVNKVALLRNQRDVGIPSVVDSARRAIEAGADGITVHPRPDERHIRRGDVYDLARLLAAQPGVEFNIEGNPFPDFLEMVLEVAPSQCTLVPDAPEQSTSDHGFCLRADGAPTAEFERLGPIVARLRARGIRVSLFLDPEEEQVEAAAELEADRIELYTEPYARAFGGPEEDEVLARYVRAAERARALGLGLNAGHDLNLRNLPRFRRSVPGLQEVSIGHALIADALELGMAGAVRAYLACLGRRPAA